jgi:formate hydrogenlyase transcriptional activator
VTDARLTGYRALLERARTTPECATAAEFFERLSAHVRELVPFDAFTIWQYDAADQMLRRCLFEPSGIKGLGTLVMPVDFGLGGRAVVEQRPIVNRLTGGPASPLAVLSHRLGFRVMCTVPASTAERQWGVLGIASRDVEEYSEELLTVLREIGSEVAAAVGRIRPPAPETAARMPVDAEHQHLLLRLTNATTSERHLPDLLRTISRLLGETIPHLYASLSLWDEEARSLRRWAVAHPDMTIEIRMDQLDRLQTKVSKALIARGVQAGLCLPLKTRRGIYGVLNVASRNADAFPIPEIMLLWQLARQVALSIENAIYFDRLEQYRRKASDERDRFKLLLDINNTLVTELDAHSLWSSVLETVRRTLDHDYASLVLFNGGTRTLHLEAATYYDERGVLQPSVVTSLDRSPIALMHPGSGPRVFKGPELDQFDVAGFPSLRSTGLQSVCCVPLATRRGGLGALNIASRRTDAFSQAEVDLLGDIAGQVAIAVENTLAFREISELKNRLAEEKLYLEEEITSQHDFKEMVGDSHALKMVLQQIQAVAPTDATVLILGETGTGKELLARALHDLSRRRAGPFIRFNGAALPVGLVESELFGHEKGAFTGAGHPKTGRLELANRGTLFLDEVGDIPLEVQPKLLRALQEREFERLGSTRTQHIDIRLVAATNRNLEQMVERSTFRSDLYYRLSVFPIHAPALRDRRDDIPALVRHFTQKFSRAMGRSITTSPQATMSALQAWPWPGNIRELQNVIERAVILSPGSVLQVPDAAIQPVVRHERSDSRSETRYRLGERDMILEALSESKGVVAGPQGAAARLGLKRTTLQSKMRKLGIKRQTY